MKKALILLLNLIFSVGNFYAQSDGPGWKAGVATVRITPEYPMWMAGYASRDHPSEGTLHDLWAKALAIRDKAGRTAVLVTSDLVGFTKTNSDNIRNRCAARYGLTRAQIALNSSHTHTGPEVDLEKFSWRMVNPDPEQVNRIIQYNKKLENDIVDLVGKALSSMKPAEIYAGNGIARFQVNRRNNQETSILTASEVNGPNDYAVPVIRVADSSERMIAVVFGYACHATVLGTYQWSGDYPGFAQIELEKSHPGTIAMFFQGAGANQNPIPRRTVALAHQYGKELSAAVDRVLSEDMSKISPDLSYASSEISLRFAKVPSRADLLKVRDTSSGLRKAWAVYLLGMLEKGKPLLTSYPYPVQVWNIGGQPVMILGGELVVDYAIALKKIFGQHIFVMGYSNDPNMAYIPSLTILNEGGYEGETAMEAKGLPSKWASDIEDLIINETVRLAKKAGVQAGKK